MIKIIKLRKISEELEKQFKNLDWSNIRNERKDVIKRMIDRSLLSLNIAFALYEVEVNREDR